MARTPSARLAPRALRVAIASYLGLWGLAWAISDRVAFQPPDPTAAPDGLSFLDVGEGVRLSVLHLERPGARRTVLFSHGNAEDLADIAAHLAELSTRLDVSVLGYDYRGYGKSGGRPGEAAAYADEERIYRHLVGARGVPPERIVLHGRSLGGAVAADLASRVPVAGLVLESTFASSAALVFSFPIFPFEPFPVAKKVARATCPTLQLHGSRDTVVPPWHARHLHDASAARSKRLVVVEGAGHDDVADVAGDAYFESLHAFLETLGP